LLRRNQTIIKENGWVPTKKEGTAPRAGEGGRKGEGGESHTSSHGGLGTVIKKRRGGKGEMVAGEWGGVIAKGKRKKGATLKNRRRVH